MRTEQILKEEKRKKSRKLTKIEKDESFKGQEMNKEQMKERSNRKGIKMKKEQVPKNYTNKRKIKSSMVQRRDLTDIPLL